MINNIDQAHAEALEENEAHDLAMEQATDLTAAMLVQFATPRIPYPGMPRALRNRIKGVQTLACVPPWRLGT
jgi:hypothetical protein